MLNAIEMQHPIVFFDGVCNLCNGFVDWLVRHDTEGRFKVASLQGSTAQRILPANPNQNLDSVIVYENGQIYRKSTAVLKVLGGIAAPWRRLSILRWIPAPLRDWAYDFIATHRYRLFGKRDSCRLPTPAEKARFLD